MCSSFTFLQLHSPSGDVFHASLRHSVGSSGAKTF